MKKMMKFIMLCLLLGNFVGIQAFAMDFESRPVERMRMREIENQSNGSGMGTSINLSNYFNQYSSAAAPKGGGRFILQGSQGRDYLVKDRAINSGVGPHGGSYYKRYVGGKFVGTYSRYGVFLRH